MDRLDEQGPDKPHIVELTWGRPHQATVREHAEDGSLLGVALVVSREAPDPTRRMLCCTYAVWHAVLALGRRYGWMPTGTIPAARSADAWAQRGWFDNGYDPDGWIYAKQIQGADAADLSAALERLLETGVASELQSYGTPRRGAAADAECLPFVRVHDKLSPECLREIIAFLRKGPCNLCWAAWPWGA